MNSSNSLRGGLSTVLLSLFAFLAVGCGSSSNDFVLNDNFATTGSLAYLLQVNNVTSVPNGTATLRFDLYDNSVPANGTLVLTTESALTDTVIVDSLPPTVRSTVVTAFDSNGFPIGQATVNSQVVTGTNGEVDLSNVTFTAITFDSVTATPDPVNLANEETRQLGLEALFSSGASPEIAVSTFATVASFTSGDENVAQVSDSGVVSVVDAGMTTITASYTINGVTRSDTVDVNTSIFNVSVTFLSALAPVSNEFEEYSVGVGTSRQPSYVSRLTGPDGQTESIAASNLSFTFDPPVSGFSVNNQGEVSVSNGVSPSTTAKLNISYTDGDNRTFTDVMVITAVSTD